MSDVNAVDAICSLKPDVESICDTTRIVLRESKSSTKETKETGHTSTGLPGKNPWHTPRLIPLPVRLTSLPRKVYRIIQGWVDSEQYDKICELADRIKAILNNEGIVISEYTAHSPDITWHRSLCELTLMMGNLSDAIRRNMGSRQIDTVGEFSLDSF